MRRPSAPHLTAWLLGVAVVASLADPAAAQVAAWGDYAGDAQHSALSTSPAADLNAIRWQTPVDLAPQFSGNDLLVHYGSPLITAGNTVVVPVKTGAAGGFQVEAHAGTDGRLLWTQTTDYLLPPRPADGWTPSYSPAIAPGNRLYYPGAGGTVLTRGGLDAAGAATPNRLAFFGLSNYTANQAAYYANVFINTPITADAAGDVYFGYQVTNPAAVGGLRSGIARIDAAGNATFIPAATAANDATIAKVVQNCAPALSPDGSTVYVAVTTANGSTRSGSGYLLALNSTTLAPTGRADLRDVQNPGNRAILSEDGTASPTVGPDGDVYFGVLENPFASSKGWLLHFSANLTQSKPAGAFGWDDTASVVPRSMVPSYHGTSPYLLMTKYNNYAGLGGDGKNKIAVLDPNATQTDARTGATVMQEVLTIQGLTSDEDFPGQPGAVREWCINTAAVDPFSGSVLANSEDGRLYRWDLATDSFTQSITLTPGVGEAYTPTLIGPDGTVYAINDATLFAIGATPVPEPSAVALAVFALGGLAVAGRHRWRRNERNGCNRPGNRV